MLDSSNPHPELNINNHKSTFKIKLLEGWGLNKNPSVEVMDNNLV